MTRYEKRMFTVLLILAVSLAALMSRGQGQINPGQTFTDGQRLSAAQLNALVTGATILPPFYNTQTAQTNLNAGDLVLILTSGNIFKQVTGNNFLLNNVDLYGSRTPTTTIGTNALFLFADPSLGNVYSISVTNLINALASNSLAGYATNVPATVPQITNSYVTASMSGVVVSNISGTTSNIWISGGEALLQGPGNLPFLASNFKMTNNINAMGTNGIDTNTITGPRWYNHFLVSDGTNVFSVLSSNAAPVQPPNCTYSALIGEVFVTSAPAVQGFRQFNRQVWFAPTNAFSNAPAGSTAAYTIHSAGLTNIVPPNALTMSGTMTETNTTPTPFTTGFVHVAGDVNGTGDQSIMAFKSSGQTLSGLSAPFQIPIFTPQSFYEYGDAANANVLIVTVSGYGF